MSGRVGVLTTAAVVAVLLVASGCGQRLKTVTGGLNQPPVVTLNSTSAGSAVGQTAEHRLAWTATDPDGRVDHFLVTTDLGALGRESDGWNVTTERQRTLQVRRAVRGAARPAETAAPGIEIFGVRAVDEHGALSKPAVRAFFGDNVAPIVTVTQPPPNALVWPRVATSVRFAWQGSDPDGHPGWPAQYKYKLFKCGPGIPWQVWVVQPDSLRRQFAPAFAGWDSVDGKATEVTMTGLEWGAQYLFVITAIDREGAYDPVFSLDKNMVLMFVDAAGLPRLKIYSDFFVYEASNPGDPGHEFTLPGTSPVTIHWIAQGPSITGYRWALDPTSLEDGPGATAAGWSRWEPDLTSATIGPFAPGSGEVRHLFVEARDWNGALALAHVDLRIVYPSFTKDLLIVDDTRFLPDNYVYPRDPARPDSLRAPSGPWPTAAELDTFLYAMGGVRWRMTPNDTKSLPGIFKGYRFDTLGTRRLVTDLTVPFAVLAQYRHIVWISGLNDGRSALSYMSYPGHTNSLAMWVAAGGKLWALGGGFGSTTNIARNSPANDDARGPIYSSFGGTPDLVPGRFMYDWAHWQSEFRMLGLTGPGIARADRDTTTPSAIPITLPARLAPRGPVTDPLPPLRTAAAFYNPTWSIEYLTRPNHVDGPRNPSPRHAADIQLMDTLMIATSPLLPPLPDSSGSGVGACMTWYHGQDGASVVFSGFDIWTWPRNDCARLVDGVLGGIWGLSRGTGASGATASVTRRKQN